MHGTADHPLCRVISRDDQPRSIWATDAATIRYYELIDLLPGADRQNGNQRCYGDEDVRRLTFTRRCRDFGFSIEQVRK